MRISSFLLPFLFLAIVCAAQLRAPPASDNCTVAEMGKLSGLKGVHLETLLPRQHSLVFKIPPVCLKQNGVSAMACELAEIAPTVVLRGREVALARHGDAAGFAMLSVAIYCEPAPPSADL